MRPYTVLLLYAALNSDGCCSYAPRATILLDTRVPILMIRGKPTINAMINGKGPFKLALDTGNGCMRVYKWAAEEMQLAASGQTNLAIETLEIGAALFSSFCANLVDPITPPLSYDLFSEEVGIIGFPVLCLLTLDFPAQEMRLSREWDEQDAEANVVTLRVIDGVPLVPLRFADGNTEVETTVLVDTGSPIELSLPDEPRRATPKRELAGTTVLWSRAGTQHFSKYRLDTTVFLGDRAVFHNPEVLYEAHRGRMGMGLLRFYAVTFDRRNNIASFIRRKEIMEKRDDLE